MFKNENGFFPKENTSILIIMQRKSVYFKSTFENGIISKDKKSS